MSGKGGFQAFSGASDGNTIDLIFVLKALSGSYKLTWRDDTVQTPIIICLA